MIAKTSSWQTVNPNVFGYSAGGSMDWDGGCTHLRNSKECKNEIYHVPELDDLFLISFGIDAQKGYYQFSFYEESMLTSNKILENWGLGIATEREEVKDLLAIDFDCKTIIDFIATYKWDTYAAGVLTTLCIKWFGKDCVEECRNPEKGV